MHKLVIRSLRYWKLDSDKASHNMVKSEQTQAEVNLHSSN